MALLQRKIYIGGLLVWLLYVILFPSWTGRSYNQVVGLERDHAPIWNPPTSDGSSWGWTRNSVRWPLFPPNDNQASYVEISLGRVFARGSIGIIILGFIFRITSLVYRSVPADTFLSTGWSVSLCLVLAWLCILVIAPFSSATVPGETDIRVITILSVGALGGLVFGLWQNAKNRDRPQTPPEDADGSSACTRIALKGRSPIVFVSRAVGALALLGACISGLLMGLGLEPAIAATLLCMSIAVFSCIELDRWRPGWGGFILCGLTIIAVFVISLFLVPDSPRYDVFVAALSSFCIGLPMFVTGSLLFLSAQRQLSRLDYGWWIELLLAAMVTGYFLWHTEATIEKVVLQWLGLNM